MTETVKPEGDRDLPQPSHGVGPVVVDINGASVPPSKEERECHCVERYIRVPEFDLTTGLTGTVWARCARGEHDVVVKHGLGGILTTIFCFPLGLICFW